MMKHSEELTPEFSRPLEVARVPKLGSHEKIAADKKECAALAKRFQVPKVHAVSAELFAKSWRGGGFRVTGEARVDLDQVSVVSLDEFRSEVSIPVERYFLNMPPDAEEDSELDIDPIDNGIVDLGEVVAEAIALELDPYPRMPGEVFESGPEPEIPEEEKKPNPFNVLKFPSTKK
jgi:uncharacterized metal-binding protein YceD (DUF177 family)